MKTLLKGISISVLLLAGWSAQADPGQGRGLREGMRQEWQQPRHDRSAYQGEGERYQGRGQQGQEQDARPQGRMSPEQRQALRRQIGEAGQDIYRFNRR
jgi:hypothetical protein